MNLNLNYDKMNGLIPAVIADDSTLAVLMTGFMNEEAVNKTIETGKVTFFSRTRNSLWVKGETSGNFLHVKRILPDCDNDTLLIYAEPQGSTCHTGAYSCFGDVKKSGTAFLNELTAVIKERRNASPDESYTAKLFQRGENRIIQKVGEEAIETVIAAKNDDKAEIINEASDLIFHLMVMLDLKGLSLEDISDNLLKRHRK